MTISFKKILAGIAGILLVILSRLVWQWKNTGEAGKLSATVLSLVFFIFGLASFYVAAPEDTTRAATTFINTSTYDNSSSNSAVVDKPTNTAEDDIIFTLIGRNDDDAPNSVPSGWTLLGTYIDNMFEGYWLYYKVAGASEPADYTWGWANSKKTKVTKATYRGGFDTADPIDVVSNTAYTTANTTLRAASMNVAAADSTLLFFGSLIDLFGATFTKPATQDDNWAEDYDGGSTDSDEWATICSCVWSGSGASGVMDTTISASKHAKHAFAVALNVTGGAPPAERRIIKIE